MSPPEATITHLTASMLGFRPCEENGSECQWIPAPHEGGERESMRS